jgi:hypothetical protein
VNFIVFLEKNRVLLITLIEQKLFDFPNVNFVEWELQYGINNYKQAKAEKGKELFIRNYYQIPSLIGSRHRDGTLFHFSTKCGQPICTAKAG